jgi:hypothetical protein
VIVTALVIIANLAWIGALIWLFGPAAGYVIWG